MLRKIMLLLMLTPVIAQTYPSFNFDFLSGFADAITANPQLFNSLSFAALATAGLYVALSLAKIEGRALGILSVIIFITMTGVVYITGLWALMIPFVGYLFMTGIYVILWLVYRGVQGLNAGPLSKIVFGAGLVITSLFGLVLEIPVAALVGMLGGGFFIVRGIMDWKEEGGELGKLGSGEDPLKGLKDFAKYRNQVIPELDTIKMLAGNNEKKIQKLIKNKHYAIYTNALKLVDQIEGDDNEKKLAKVIDWINAKSIEWPSVIRDNIGIKIQDKNYMGYLVTAVIQKILETQDYTLNMSEFENQSLNCFNCFGHFLKANKTLTINGDMDLGTTSNAELFWGLECNVIINGNLSGNKVGFYIKENKTLEVTELINGTQIGYTLNGIIKAKNITGDYLGQSMKKGTIEVTEKIKVSTVGAGMIDGKITAGGLIECDSLSTQMRGGMIQANEINVKKEISQQMTGGAIYAKKFMINGKTALMALVGNTDYGSLLTLGGPIIIDQDQNNNLKVGNDNLKISNAVIGIENNLIKSGGGNFKLIENSSNNPITKNLELNDGIFLFDQNKLSFNQNKLSFNQNVIEFKQKTLSINDYIFHFGNNNINLPIHFNDNNILLTGTDENTGTLKLGNQALQVDISNNICKIKAGNAVLSVNCVAVKFPQSP